MSRSGYSECCDGWELIRWRGAVASAFRGKRGQAFLKEMAAAMDAMPDKRLISNCLQVDGNQTSIAFFNEVILGGDVLVDDSGKEIRIGDTCAMGSVAKSRGLDTSKVSADNREGVADLLDIAPAMAAEIAYMNDEVVWYTETPEQRWSRMRQWIDSEIINNQADCDAN